MSDISYDGQAQKDLEVEVKAHLGMTAMLYFGEKYSEALSQAQEAERQLKIAIQEAQRRKVFFAEDVWREDVEGAKKRCVAQVKPEAIDENTRRGLENEKEIFIQIIGLALRPKRKEDVLDFLNDPKKLLPVVNIVQNVWTHFNDYYRKGESGPSDIIEYLEQVHPFFLSGMIVETLKAVYPDVYKVAMRAEQERKERRRKQVESIEDRAIREAAHRSDDITAREEEEGRQAGRYIVEMGGAEEFLTEMGLDKAQELIEEIDRKRGVMKSFEDTVLREGGNILSSLLVGVDNAIRRKAGMPLRKGGEPPQQRIEKTPATQLREVEQADKAREGLLLKKRENLYPDGRWQHEGLWIQDVVAALKDRADDVLEEYQEYKRRLDDAVKK